MALVAFDARKYFDYGIGTYIQQLTRALAQRSSPFSFVMYVSSADEEKIRFPPGWKRELVQYKKYSAQEILRLGYDARKAGADIFHAPHYTLPIGLCQKSVVTIHDLIHLRFPSYHNVFKRSYAWAMFRHAVTNSGAVITDSEFIRQDILRTFSVNEKKIHVTHLGVSEDFAPMRDSTRGHDFRSRYRLVNPYILYVGSLKPHKNIPFLFRAFKNISTKQRDIDLVMIGERVSEHKRLTHEINILGIQNRVKELGEVSSADLISAYSLAEVFVLPSEYEGFGFPALEAMACGTPVVVSNAGSLPEIVGDAALVVPSHDVGALEEAMMNIIRQPGIKRSLVERGFQHVRKYSWCTTAKQTLAIYESLLES
ncbi:MAG: glycosyltransferase family 4 protein [Ignavibacteria bacterium]|nr:glycosyltransferase family 4 protein [Ignavibacteria bacterium]